MIRERRSRREYIDNYSTCVRVVKKLSWPFSRRWDSFFWRARGGSFFKRLVVIHRIDGRLSIELWKRRLTFHDTRVDGSSVEFFDNSARALTFRANVWINRRGYIKGRGLKGRFLDRKRVNYVSLFSKHVPSHLREWIKFEWPLENACRWNESAQFPSKILSRMRRFREY